MLRNAVGGGGGVSAFTEKSVTKMSTLLALRGCGSNFQEKCT